MGREETEGFKDDEADGLHPSWYENGQKAGEDNYKDGKCMSAETWKPDGEKCPVTNLKDGNGVWVVYYDNGRSGQKQTTRTAWGGWAFDYLVRERSEGV